MGIASEAIVHHTADNGPDSFDAAYLANTERYQMNRATDPLSSFAYTRIVFQSGEVAGGRDWGTKTGATGGHNDHTVAIVAAGNFDNKQPTDALIEAIADEIVWGTLNGFIVRGALIEGHGGHTAGTRFASACPGANLRSRIQGFASVTAVVDYKLENLPVGIPAPTPVHQPRCVNVCANRTLKRGSSGVCVKTLQNLLRAKGFNPGITDGKFGKGTDNAVRCFQGSAGLSPDGSVGPLTWSALG